ncbi:NUDIX domain-containing protein [Nanoarchaeota archaeon]
MTEKLEIYDMDGNLLRVQDRDEYYESIREEFKKNGKITTQVKAIRMLLMNERGMLYIQKRSPLKAENPGLYDKTVGGHVKAGHTWDLTVVQECHEELGFPAVVLTDEEFKLAVRATDLSIIGLFRKVDLIEKFISIRKRGNEHIKQPYITAIYVGYYDGGIRFKDGEATGIEVLSLEDLQNRIKKNPKDFTEDLKFMIKKFKKYLIPAPREVEETHAY